MLEKNYSKLFSHFWNLIFFKITMFTKTTITIICKLLKFSFKEVRVCGTIRVKRDLSSEIKDADKADLYLPFYSLVKTCEVAKESSILAYKLCILNSFLIYENPFIKNEIQRIYFQMAKDWVTEKDGKRLRHNMPRVNNENSSFAS